MENYDILRSLIMGISCSTMLYISERFSNKVKKMSRILFMKMLFVLLHVWKAPGIVQHRRERVIGSCNI